MLANASGLADVIRENPPGLRACTRNAARLAPYRPVITMVKTAVSQAGFPSVLQHLYSQGRNLHDILLGITHGTDFGRELSGRLITPADPKEFSELLMAKTFAALQPQAPAMRGLCSSEQQSTQAEVVHKAF